MKQIKINGKFNITIKPSGQGFVGIVKELPIVIESSTEEQLKIDMTKALSTCFLNNPALFKEQLSIEIPA